MTQLPAILRASTAKPSLNKVVVGSLIAGMCVLALLLWMVWQVQRQMQALQPAAAIPVATTIGANGLPQTLLPLSPGAIVKHWEISGQWLIFEVQVAAQPPYWLVYDLKAQRTRTQIMVNPTR